MRFARQVRLSRWVGIALIGLGGAMMLTAAAAGPDWARRLADPATGLLAAGLALAVFGGVIRPIHRWTWFNVVAPAAIYSDQQKRRAAPEPKRPWLHLDKDLRDADLREREAR